VTELLQHLVNGLSLGTLYALIALGYTMVYGVLKLINFAHGDVYMVGAFAGYYVAGALGAGEAPSLPKAVAVSLGAMLLCGLLGLLIERAAYRPLRERPRITALITAIGVSFLLEYGFQLQPIPALGVAFPPGPSPRFFPEILDLGPPLEWLGVSVSRIDVLGFFVALGLMAALQFVVYRTRFGKAMRAVSFDARVAGLMGIPVDRVIAGTFFLGSALAAAAAIISASRLPKLDPLMGLMPGLKAFVAAVLGGIGSVPGAMAGGLLLGLTEEYVAGYTVSSFRDAIAFSVLILVLLLRPQGLLGRTTVEKV
jgi:branched-chain amino acid transport system permease protein